MNNLDINDIFPPQEIPDNSIYIAIFMFLGLLLLIALLFYYVYKKIFKKDKEEEWLNILKSCEISQKDAYKIGYYASFLSKTAQEKKLLKEIEEELFIYKYKKDGGVDLDSTKDTQEKLQALICMIETRND